MLARRDDLRAALARFLGAPPETIALTTSTTEGCNVVLNGLGIGPGDEVVTTDSEHPGLFGGLVASGADLQVVPVRDLPVADLAGALDAAITERTKLIALSHVSWLTGARDADRRPRRTRNPPARRRRSGGRRDSGCSRRPGLRLLHRLRAEMAPRPRRHRRALHPPRARRGAPHGDAELWIMGVRRRLHATTRRRAPRASTRAGSPPPRASASWNRSRSRKRRGRSGTRTPRRWPRI